MYCNICVVVVFAGHVDAGKSTLMGHLLCLLGNVSKKSMHKYPFHLTFVSNRTQEIYYSQQNNVYIVVCNIVLFPRIWRELEALFLSCIFEWKVRETKAIIYKIDDSFRVGNIYTATECEKLSNNGVPNSGMQLNPKPIMTSIVFFDLGTYEMESKKAGKASFAYAWILDETGEERER